MIIIVCTDDKDLEENAQALSNDEPEIYGSCFKVFSSTIPRLLLDESLFITAHGATRGDDGNPVIGSSANDFYLNAVHLFDNLAGIFDPNYSGKIYISACESADAVRGSFSFAETFKNVVEGKTNTKGVFGQIGSVGLTIPPPSSKGWTQA